MKPPKKFQTFFYKRHFTSLVEVIWGEPTRLLLEVENAINLWACEGGTERERKGCFGEMALLDRRNGTSRVKKCRFSLNEEIG